MAVFGRAKRALEIQQARRAGRGRVAGGTRGKPTKSIENNYQQNTNICQNIARTTNICENNLHKSAKNDQTPSKSMNNVQHLQKQIKNSQNQQNQCQNYNISKTIAHTTDICQTWQTTSKNNKQPQTIQQPANNNQKTKKKLAPLVLPLN